MTNKNDIKIGNVTFETIYSTCSKCGDKTPTAECTFYTENNIMKLLCKKCGEK